MNSFLFKKYAKPPEDLSKTIWIGDTVSVIHRGYHFPCYNRMIRYMKLDKFSENFPVKYKDLLFKVLAVQPRNSLSDVGMNEYNFWLFDELLYGIEDIDSGDQYIVGIKGLKVVKKSHSSSFIDECDFCV